MVEITKTETSIKFCITGNDLGSFIEHEQKVAELMAQCKEAHRLRDEAFSRLIGAPLSWVEHWTAVWSGPSIKEDIKQMAVWGEFTDPTKAEP